MAIMGVPDSERLPADLAGRSDLSLCDQTCTNSGSSLWIRVSAYLRLATQGAREDCLCVPPGWGNRTLNLNRLALGPMGGGAPDKHNDIHHVVCRMILLTECRWLWEWQRTLVIGWTGQGDTSNWVPNNSFMTVPVGRGSHHAISDHTRKVYLKKYREGGV